ncbi:MAG: hypothetical protein H6553_03410 [Chitinophagales bacterium]|nr:hypothetical protein [Chitinophagales bacterium]
MKIAFIINGKIKKLNKVEQEIKSTFNTYTIELYISSYAGQMSALCKKAIEEQCTHFIFVGGDGTLNEGINGIVDYFQLNDNRNINDFDWHKIAQLKIGIYPAGSANDFVKTIYKNTTLQNIKSLIDNNSQQLTDIGWVQYYNNNQQQSVRFFMNITDVGMGGETVKRKDAMPSWLGADINYFWSITSTLATYKNTSVQAFNDDFCWEGKVVNMVVANGKYFGNGLGVAPDAKVDDGLFSFIIIGDVSLGDYFKNLGTVKKCIKIDHPEVQYHQFEKITIQSSDKNIITIDMDGEYIGNAPMTLQCLTQKVCFIR